MDKLTFPNGVSFLLPSLQQTAIAMGLNFKTYFLLCYLANKLKNNTDRRIIDCNRYYMINYDEITNSLPMLATSRNTLQKEHFTKLVNLGFIVRNQVNNGIGVGTQTGIMLGESYYKLFNKHIESHSNAFTRGIAKQIGSKQEQLTTNIQKHSQEQIIATEYEKTEVQEQALIKDGLSNG